MSHSPSLQREARVGDLEEQLHVLASQRDAAILELSSAREEAQASAAALSNLQSVLEQFQRGQYGDWGVLSSFASSAHFLLYLAPTSCLSLPCGCFRVRFQVDLLPPSLPPSLPLPLSDHSSELNEALKRSQLELANTLCELNTLKTTFTTAQVLTYSSPYSSQYSSPPANPCTVPSFSHPLSCPCVWARYP